jgi:hypothetical protein
MKFNDLTVEDKQYLTSIYFNSEISWQERMNRLSSFFKVTDRTISKWISKLKLTTKHREESPQLKEAKSKHFNKKSKKFIITWAQNDTPVHEKFILNIEEYAKYLGAEIHIIAGRYKNPTSVFTDKNYDIWDLRIQKYLDANRHDIHKYVSIMSDVKIQPTAVNPMSGLEGMSGINSCIFGSPKVQLETIPILEGNRPKMMVTTGACTYKNYTDSKSGKKGEFHHTLGFVLVEIKNEEVFFIRQVTALDNGDFSDLFYEVKNTDGISSVVENHNFSALILGDLHYGQHDEKVLENTFDFIKSNKIENIVLHDVFDGYSINHHEIKDPFIQYQKEIAGLNSLKDEIDSLLDGLEKFKDQNVIVVRSNHDDFLDRWLKDTDWRKMNTPKNSLEYVQYASLLLSGEAKNGVIPYLINKRFPTFKTLGRCESFKINGWEVGQHGDIGSGGSRGSLLQFRKLNTKIIVGHYHAPGRKDGAISVGTSTKLRLGYNLGASNWLQSHVLIHSNGKAQHLNFIDGEFTTFK